MRLVHVAERDSGIQRDLSKVGRQILQQMLVKGFAGKHSQTPTPNRNCFSCPEKEFVVVANHFAKRSLQVTGENWRRRIRSRWNAVEDNLSVAPGVHMAVRPGLVGAAQSIYSRRLRIGSSLQFDR